MFVPVDNTFQPALAVCKPVPVTYLKGNAAIISEKVGLM